MAKKADNKPLSDDKTIFFLQFPSKIAEQNCKIEPN